MFWKHAKVAERIVCIQNQNMRASPNAAIEANQSDNSYIFRDSR